jgi:hypothetical protein
VSSDVWRPLTRYERRALDRGYSIWDMVFQFQPAGAEEQQTQQTHQAQ